MSIRATALALLFLLLPAAGSAAEHELSLLAGTMQDTDTGKPSYTWQLEFRNWVNEHFGVSVSYLNEGHVPNHHRDGGAVQVWTSASVIDPRLHLSGGIGPYYYFDSTQPIPGSDYTNEHGWGGIGSVALSWQGRSRLIYQLRANVVETGSLDSQALLFGVGYQWDSRPQASGPANAAVHDAGKKNELSLLAGRTIVNSFDSEHALALGVEYRRRLGRLFEGTIGVLDEGETGTIDRAGLEAQLWLARDFLDDRISLGVGSGGYYAGDRDHRQDQGERDFFLSGITSITAGFRFAADWKIRTTWSRVRSHYDRDTDVVMIGLGYLF